MLSFVYNIIKNIRVFVKALFTITVILFSFYTTAKEGIWKKGGMNDPSFFNLKEKSLNNLPLKGSLNYIPMTSTHWLHQFGGISYNYHRKSPTEFLTKKQLLKKKMISNLSPAEKYDILRGDYNYTMTKQERLSQKNYKNPWEGHCHGWVVAALRFKLPTKEKTLINKDGIKILFYPQDIMAIYSYFEGMKQTPWDYWVIDHKLPWHFEKYGFEKDSPKTKSLISSIQFSPLKEAILNEYRITKDHSSFKTILSNRSKNYNLPFYTPYLGLKNDLDKHINNDPNPGALHLVLANHLGIEKKGLAADTDPFKPVWNRPLYGYESKITKVISKKEKEFETKLFYIKEIDHPQEKIKNHNIQEMILKYTLYLNDNGQIIGGLWKKDSDRVDFVWSPHFSNVNHVDMFYDESLLDKLILN